MFITAVCVLFLIKKEIDPYLKLSLLADSWMVEKNGIRNEVAILLAGYLKLLSLAS